MCYLYTFIVATILHLLIRKFAANKVASYIQQTQALLKIGERTDGCTTPFKTYIHRWLSRSRDLCAAHDFGSLGFISGVTPGIHNNLITWLAHMSQRAPVYWVWGTIVALVTLPWVVWRRNLGIEKISFMSFHVALLFIVTYSIIFYIAG